jgi:hypothetical protein
MDSGTILLMLAVLSLVGFIITEFLVDPGNRPLRQVIGVIFMVPTLFLCGLGGILYLRDHKVIMLPDVGLGLGTPAPSLDSLADDFSNPQNQPGYDPNLWFCDGCNTYDTRVENDSLRFGIDSEGHTEVTSIRAFQPDHIRYLEGKLKMSEYNGPVAGDVHLMLHTDISSGWWQAVCAISGAEPGFLCQIMKGVEIIPTIEYTTRFVPVSYGEWHTAKIELNPDSFELRFYLDDQMLGAVTPADANELRGKTFTAQFGVASYFQSRHIVAYVDDIFLSTTP